MTELSIKIVNTAGEMKKERTDPEYVDLTYGEEYQPGDKIIIESSENNIPLRIQIDEVLGSALVLIVKKHLEYTVPFDSAKRAYPPISFSGNRHYLYARTVSIKEWNAYKNLALNVLDLHGDIQCYPHISANCETRGESVFAARNTIDNVTANRSHGRWPFQSWGINMQDDASLKMEFGREVEVDYIMLHTRADFPHDNWWTSIRFTFSDGEVMRVSLEKSERPHKIPLDGRVMTGFTIDELVKGDSDSLFPALSQIEVFGINK